MLKTLISAIAAATVASAHYSCAYGTSHSPAQVEGTVPIATFNYTGEGGPLNWYGLNKTANSACAKGKHQSPIVIDDSIPYTNSSLSFKIPDTNSAQLQNIGDVLQVKTNGTLTIDGDEYDLAQFHFHTPSEHRIDYEFSPMENHWVFENSKSEIAVVTFMFELSPQGVSVPLYDAVFANLGSAAIPGIYTSTPPLTFGDLEDWLEYHPIYAYSGSLTTPPCTEGVKWYISKTPLPLDVETFNRVKKVMKFNSRVTQNYLGEENLLQVAASSLNA